MSTDARWEIEADHPQFPRELLDIPDPPSKLYGIGECSALRGGLAVVGSRSATPYGLSCAERFARAAAGLGVSVISGGARGCDAAAHRGALAIGGDTVAVLGCGADVDYPTSESSLLSRIRREGCVLSELPWGHPPRRWAFPRRNRLIAGLAVAVLVVEAGLPSGTFSTADHALDAGRDVLAVPGSIYARGSAGTNRLIRSGAQAITHEEDLADALGWTRLASTGAGSQTALVEADLKPSLDAILAAPLTPDELAVALGLSVRETSILLARLETSGLAKRHPDGSYGPGRAALPGAL